MINTQEKLTTVRLSGQLGKKFGKVYKFYVASPAEAVRMLAVNLEGFSAYLNDPDRNTLYKVFVADAQINPEKELHDLSGSKEIRIAPIIQGAKRAGVMGVVLGAVLIAASFIPGLNVAVWAGASSFAMTAGIGLMLSGVSQLLSPQPKLNIQEAPNNQANTSLGVVNSSAQGAPVRLVYGERIVGSTIISAGIFASDING